MGYRRGRWTGARDASKALRHLFELRHTCAPTFEEPHVLVALAVRAILVQDARDVARAGALIGQGEDRRHRKPGRCGTPATGQHRREDDAFLWRNFEKAAGAVALSPIRPTHEGVKSTPRPEIVSTHLG